MTDVPESDVYKLFKKSIENENVHMIGTTVDTGLEWQAVDECKERISPNLHVVKERGKIYFNVTLDQFAKVQEMRSIDNIFLISDVRQFQFSKDNEESDMSLIKDAVNMDMKLEKGLEAWKTVTSFNGKLYPKLEEFEEAEQLHKAEKTIVDDKHSALTTPDVRKGRKRGRDPSISNENEILKYRVTCERTGSHAFESGQVARVIGGELQDKYHWLVDLTMYHLEFVCNVIHNELITCLRVTHESKHRRNILHFGPTTLRATVCYSLIKLANPKQGEIIMDPMCGGGSIPIEAAIAFPNTYVLCGDNHEKAVARTKSNIDGQLVPRSMDLVEWSVSELPLKDSSIDIVVTDMPFGKRSGSMTDNRVLYKKYLAELGRVSKLGTGRLVLLTYDRRSIQLALQVTSSSFKVIKMLGVNMGGLHAAVYVLKRTKFQQYNKEPNKKSSNDAVV
ncbi:tRNA (guanine(6)-N2)-methyltransferase THUMP3-like [Athalia rosae]|uniref:tRNA (guanine(6)-N2)-methyltransferase THUMP3-like n=1 Tax=Athalia rosae TaxID=37344 RepID=UPI0020334241|nr:tRNA (guanine(6)-N2)-methyltransferase THUMP3-like [Athalia rosae]